MMSKKLRLGTALVLGILMMSIFSCSPQQEKDMGFLPSAKGDKGEIILVIDTVKWNGALGEEIKKILLERIPGLPQPEPMFTVRNIHPPKFANFLKQHKNIVIVTTFDENTAGTRHLKQFFTKESIDQIMQDDELFMQTSRDDYAKGQLVINLFGKDEQTLIKNLRENKQRIQDLLNGIERQRILAEINKMQKKPLIKSIQQKYDYSLKIPDGYKLAKDSANSVWLRHPEYDFDKNLFITYKPYTSQEDFTIENIMKWRAELMRKHTKDPDNPAYYVVMQDLVPVTSRPVTIDGNYAIEARGLWRLKDRFVGGPFVSYTFVDKNTNRMYYIEGFVSAPGTTKREYIREVETILRTFKS